MAIKQVFNTSADLDYPNVLPTLDLNFANTKTLDPRITFTRSSAGSYVGADGLIKYAGVNEARFDHDPITGESLGLLIEEARTNLTSYSQELDNARWATIDFTLSANTSNTTAPDGSNTAERILETNTNFLHLFYNFNAYSITANTVYTASIFIKPINKQYVQLVFDDATTTNGGYANFDLLSGTVTASFNYGNGASISASIVSYPNNWYRISITSTAGTSSTVGRFAINGINTSNSGVFTLYTGNTSNGYYIWGAQIEQASFPTSYIPTGASTRTRAADSASITGKNFSSWYNSSEGTIFINALTKSTQDGSGFLTLDNGSAADYMRLSRGFSKFEFLVSKALGTQAQIYSVNNIITNTSFKGIVSYKTNYVTLSFNGSSVLTDVSVLLPDAATLMRIGFGYYQTYTNGTISSLTYYPKALPNSQLQSLTT